MFVDDVDIRVSAGDGGRGCLSFRREKFIPRGGPDGGDGGHGGSVYIVAAATKNTLVDFRFHPEFHAKPGKHGQGSNRTGRIGPRPRDRGAGRDAGLRAPARRGERARCRPGRGRRPRSSLPRAGGAGAATPSFVSSTNRAPRRIEPGEPGEEKSLHLQLKLRGRRRADRLPQRRQVHADFPHLRGEAEDRRLPVHDAHPEPGRRAAERRPQLRGGRRPGPHQGRTARDTAWAISSCGTSNGPRCWCTWWMCRASRAATRSRTSTPFAKS